ncbi:hypothetical protein LTR36_004201 [Oleoguttula mirabilis]|uniref:AAA+ ATPase domain-containing protein n=1 Tax=Oleoguttula mirabilis TaxID=1507867 RepID=A0AAV9JIB7_9PEZI|nr:hypothetical protein LTR36_004201 [Oleoguttula mirabilis]
MSKRAGTDTSSASQTSSVTGEAPVLTPSSTPSDTSQKGAPPPITSLRNIHANGKMDDKQKEQTASTADTQEHEQPAAVPLEQEPQADAKQPKSAKRKSACRKLSHKKPKDVKKVRGKKARKEPASEESSGDDSDADSDSESEDSSDEERSKRKLAKAKQIKKALKDKKRRKSVPDDDDSDDESGDESSSEDERKKKKAKKTKPAKKAAKDKKKHKGKKQDDDSDAAVSSSDDSVDDSSEDEAPKRKKKSTKKSKQLPSSDDEDDDTEENDGEDLPDLQSQLDALTLRIKMAGKLKKSARSKGRRRSSEKSATKSKRKSSKKGDAPDYKRVDQLWDTTLHDYKLKESAETDETEFAEYAFLVRRCFNWENKYTETVVDIKSKQLRTVLAEVMKDCKSVSLEAEEPTIDPNILFLYLEELRTYYKKTVKTKIKAEKKRKPIKKLEQQRSLCKTLVSFIDEDYADTKKTLYPLVEAGNITFDLMWALFKPNEIAITSCYGAWDEPRCFKVDYATKCQSMQRGEWYCIEGKYLEYDGKGFGHGDFEVDVEGFKGPRKINSLATYPLKYHKDAEGMKKKIIERGEQFVSMDGMQYKYHKGMAFMKKKKLVAKIHINGRIMIDPATFRRINPNYPISLIKPKDADELFSDSDDDDDDCSCCGDSDDEEAAGNQVDLENADHSEDTPKFKFKWSKDEATGLPMYVAVEVDEDGDPIRPQRLDQLSDTTELRSKRFSEEELLLTSPVVLGFAFSEKLWLEFSLSGVREIEYNESAFDSLVLPPDQKDIVRALVESHKFHAAKTIDDVVQGKGKGLVAVLHGPPGTGKTLTAEGISELLKCPLYMVSAGELGTDPARLEHELQKILDIAHSWGAVLLLDEADVFLEKREVHDIHRNALVSIFLRLLEYFQGILFLTTNRVDTFDEAFQSRIHLPLRYSDLTTKAKKSVWKMFLELVRKSDGASVAEFSDGDLDMLARHQLNGRQIKNCVRTAQALALREERKLDMGHVKKVLDVSETFDRDLKGGTGYIDAMRSYT